MTAAVDPEALWWPATTPIPPGSGRDPAPVDRVRSVSVAAYASDAFVATPKGARPAGTLRSGDLVTTRDGGAEPVIWHSAPMRLPVVRVAPAGPVTTPDSLILRQDASGGLLFGEAEVLARAGDLAPSRMEMTMCVAILLRGHGLLRIGGAWVGSFQPSPASLAALSADQRRALRRAHPRAAQLSGQAGYLIDRPILDRCGVETLRAACLNARG